MRFLESKVVDDSACLFVAEVKLEANNKHEIQDLINAIDTIKRWNKVVENAAMPNGGGGDFTTVDYAIDGFSVVSTIKSGSIG